MTENLYEIIAEAEATSPTGSPVADHVIRALPSIEDVMDAFDFLLEKLGKNHPALNEKEDAGILQLEPGISLFGALNTLYQANAGEFFPFFSRFCLECKDVLTEEMFQPLAEMIILLRGAAEPVIEGFLRNYKNPDFEGRHFRPTYEAVNRLIAQKKVRPSVSDAPAP